MSFSGALRLETRVGVEREDIARGSRFAASPARTQKAVLSPASRRQSSSTAPRYAPREQISAVPAVEPVAGERKSPPPQCALSASVSRRHDRAERGRRASVSPLSGRSHKRPKKEGFSAQPREAARNSSPPERDVCRLLPREQYRQHADRLSPRAGRRLSERAAADGAAARRGAPRGPKSLHDLRDRQRCQHSREDAFCPQYARRGERKREKDVCENVRRAASRGTPAPRGFFIEPVADVTPPDAIGALARRCCPLPRARSLLFFRRERRFQRARG